jgi:hypothetical protein
MDARGDLVGQYSFVAAVKCWFARTQKLLMSSEE